MKRVIIGLLGDNSSNKKELVALCVSNGFHAVKISDKVKELAGYIFNNEDEFDMDEATLNTIRDRGYKVNRMYWVNLLLSSMNNDHKFVLLEDIREEDVIPGLIFVFESDNISPDEMGKKIKQLLKKQLSCIKADV